MSDAAHRADLVFRRLAHAEMAAAAKVHRAAFDAALPWLAGLHTPDEDKAFFEDVVFPASAVWGALEGGALLGIIAFRAGWIDQLYVLPRAHRRGIGRRLLGVAKARQDALQLWTFQRNALARAFYEADGFVAVEETAGTGNEERHPDVRYAWRQTA